MLNGCGEKGHDGGQLPPKVTILPESELKMVLWPCSRSAPWHVTSTWTPATNEILLAESLLKDYVRTRLDRSLDKYYRQYIGIGIDGKRVVYVNAVRPYEEDRDFETEAAEMAN
jgi:hypothetical protein